MSYNGLLAADFSCIIDTVLVTSATIHGVEYGSKIIDSDTVITCTADDQADPPASYIWINHITGSQSAGSQFTLQPGTQYKLTCVASNNFQRHNPTAYVEFKSKFTLYFCVFCV